MSQSLVKNYIHLVFSTKHRQRLILPELQPKLWAYQAGIFRETMNPSIVIGGIEDHVHALFLLSKNSALKDVVQQVKHLSSRWVNSEGMCDTKFGWQGGYGAFSVSSSLVPTVTQYIERQAEHHRTISFEDELRELFRLHDMEFDERYVWD